MCNTSHAWRTDPEALIASKSHGIAARPSYAGHTLMENRNGLLLDAELTQATGTAERAAAADRARALRTGATLGADKGYDTYSFITKMSAAGDASCGPEPQPPWARQSMVGRRVTQVTW